MLPRLFHIVTYSITTLYNGGDSVRVGLGCVAVNIATTLGFQKGDDLLEVLRKGSMFSENMQEQWRHQLLEYDIVSFWGTLDHVSRALRQTVVSG